MKLKIFFIALVVALISGYLYVKDSRHKTLNATSLKVEVKTQQENTKLYTLSAEYPYFDEVSPDFNKQIKNLVVSKIDEFKKNVNENSFFNLTWSAQQLNKKNISLVISINSFVGGANEIQEIKTFNYDVIKRKDIQLADLFVGKQDFLQDVSNYVKGDLVSQIQDSKNQELLKMLNEAASPNEENFKNFTFDDQTITFYFPKGQVLPGAFGEQKVMMPRKAN